MATDRSVGGRSGTPRSAANKGSHSSRELRVHVAKLFVPLALLLCGIGCGLLPGYSSLVLLLIPTLLGIHVLLSWQWALAAVIVEITDTTLIAPLVACFGYCIIAVPFYVIALNMYFTLGISLPERVKFGWANWILTNLLNADNNDKEIVFNVLRRDSIQSSFCKVFVQFDFLCHLLPSMILLQKYAAEITPLTCVLTVMLFGVWSLLFNRYHLEAVRIYEVLRTGKLTFVEAPPGLSIGRRMQRQYLLTPELSLSEEKLGLTAAFVSTTVIAALSYAGHHELVVNWLGLGVVLSVEMLWKLYYILIFTGVVTTMYMSWQIFFAETSCASGKNRPTESSSDASTSTPNSTRT